MPSPIDADIIIPARYNSSRFPGKPLHPILGTPLLQRVVDVSKQVAECSRIYVATDDFRIEEYCRRQEINVIMTSKECFTGTDRVAEANLMINGKLIINVQGDEPCISPDDIRLVYEAKKKSENYVINGYCEFTGEKEIIETSIPKVVIANDGRLIYASRANVPYKHKEQNTTIMNMKRQVCIYAFSAEELIAFNFGGKRSEIEKIEDIEILRFLELGINVKMIKLGYSLAVDYPSDVAKVEKHINDNIKSKPENSNS